VGALADLSRSRNRELGVTGCLIFGGAKFAQVLEGPQAAVESLMRSICVDPRHAGVTILEQGLRPERRFAEWALGYSGPSSYVQETIGTPLSEVLSGSPPNSLDLLRMMSDFHADHLDPRH
jgi:hypothetical protein